MNQVKNSFLNRRFTRISSRMSADLSAVIRVLYLRQSALKINLFTFLLVFVLTTLFLKIPAFVAGEQSVVEYTSFNLRDPFESLLMKEKEKSQILVEQGKIVEKKTTTEINLPQFSIQGTIWDAAVPQAIIDDRIVKIGDVVKEAEVLDIKKEGVTLLFQNKKFTIKPR